MLHHSMLQSCNKICVNHYICNVVNSSFFLICVDIRVHITPTPAVAPAPPLFTAQLSALCNVMTCGESSQTATLHHHIEDMFSFNGLLVFDNCYAISCHALAWKIPLDFHTKGVLQMPITYSVAIPPRVWCSLAELHTACRIVKLPQFEVSNVGLYTSKMYS